MSLSTDHLDPPKADQAGAADKYGMRQTLWVELPAACLTGVAVAGASLPHLIPLGILRDVWAIDIHAVFTLHRQKDGVYAIRVHFPKMMYARMFETTL